MATPPAISVPTDDTSSKSRLALTLLSFFLGQLGIHRFYAGKIGTGTTMLILTIIGYATFIFIIGFAFLAAVGIWNLIDFILAVSGNFRDNQGKVVRKWD
jgi:TM2 domain-containing membrane protein YozV